jgi:hypothetical protein
MVRRRVVRALFDNPEHITAADVSQSEILKSLLKIHVPNSIEYAIINKKIYACVFEINETNEYLEIHKNHWIQALETCLLWYIEEENYEIMEKELDDYFGKLHEIITFVKNNNYEKE